MKPLVMLLAMLVSATLCAQAVQDSLIYMPAKLDGGLLTDSTRFKPMFFRGEPETYSLSIMNKWGNSIFQTNIPEQGWNGRMHNRDAATNGTYMWILNFDYGDSLNYSYQGYVTCENMSPDDKIYAVDTITCRPSVYIPNVFTPNGDGTNDQFMPRFGGCPPIEYVMWIFDRWGNLIFETKDINQGWTGNTGTGDFAQTDSYVWRIKCKFYEGDKRKPYIGHVALIR